MNRFDVILLGLCMVGIGMGRAFRIYDRDLARLTLLMVVGYVGLVGLWGWQAYEFGERYAKTQELPHAVVKIEPQALSPLNWRVMVIEPNGKIHATLITLGRGAGTRSRNEVSDDPYRPRTEAMWKVERRYGGIDVPEDIQRRVRMAWYGWQGTPFGWLGRYAIFERMYMPQELGIAAITAAGGIECVGFRDFRAVTPNDIARGTFVICPWRDERVRIFRPRGEMDKKGMWPGMVELVAFSDLRR